MFDNPNGEFVYDIENAEAEIQRVLQPEFDKSFYCDRYRDINTDLVDPLAIVQAALETGISAASTALTADVLVRRNDPSVAVNP